MTNKKDSDTADGFEEFIEHFNIKSSSSDPFAKNDYGKKRHEAQLQLINFMELEYTRLNKLKNFLTLGLPVLQQSGTGPAITRDLVAETNVKRDELAEYLAPKSSPMNLHITHLWSKTFSQPQK